MKNEPSDLDNVVKVHVVSLPAIPPAAESKPRYRTVCETITLSPTDPVTELLPASEFRVSAAVQALDDDIVIHTNKGHAASGHGATILATNTAPWPVCESGVMYVAAATQPPTGPLRVTVTQVYIGE